MKHITPEIHIQGTQAGGDSVEVTLMTKEIQFSFFTTEPELDELVEKLIEEIKLYREIVIGEED